MKIGILTYHRSLNYGALLQAVALRSVLSEMGHEATFVDYWPDYHRHMYALFSFQALRQQPGLRAKLSYAKLCLLKYPYRRERAQHIQGFINAYIEPYTSSPDESYDLLIHGSDQIWRKQPEINCYNPVYFGNNDIDAKRRISYAASMGVISTQQSDQAMVHDYLAHLDAISVRETALKHYVEEMGYVCRQDVDPTLLMQGSDWQRLFNLSPYRREKYVLLYQMLTDSFDLAQLRAFAQCRGLRLITLYAHAEGRNSDEAITTGSPIDFLRLILGAEYVFTTSFHGLVFALQFHKPFYAAFSTNAGRAKSLLEMLGLGDRLLAPMSAIPHEETAIDYATVDKLLATAQQASRDFLLHQEL